MSDLGLKLKQTREELGISLDEISKETNIKVNFLKLIEKGDFCSLPSFVHARGFIKKYAEVLGMDLANIDELLNVECPREKFSEFCKHTQKDYEKVFSDRSIKIILLIIILFLALFVVYIYLSKNIGDNTETKNTEGLEQKSEVVEDNKTVELNSKVLSTVESPVKNVVEPMEILKKSVVKDVVSSPLPDKKVVFSFTDVCWVHISVDNVSEYDFIADKGLVKNIPVKEHFSIDIGNANSVIISYKDQKFENFGKYREPVKGLFFYFDNGTLNFNKLKR